jgi:predicted dehydrogenase
MTNMSIRDVPADVRDELVRRARANRQSLQQYLLALVTAEVRRPDIFAIWDRAGKRARAAGSEYSFADVTSDVRELRERGRPE